MIKKRIDGIFQSVNKKSSRPLILILVLAMLTSGFLIGCDKKEEEDLTDKLYKNKTEFIGDNSKVSAITRSLEYPKGYDYESIEIYSKDEENGDVLNQLNIIFKEDSKRGGNRPDETQFMTQSSVLFSLIDNLDVVFYTTQEKDGRTTFLALDRAQIDSFTTSVLGMKSEELGSSKTKFKKLVDYYQDYEKNLGEETDQPGYASGSIGNETVELKIDLKPDTISNQGLVLIIENKYDKDFIYTSQFVIQKMENNKWKEAESIFKPGEDEPEGLQVYPLKAREKAEHEIKFNSKYKNLEPGHYRIIERIIEDNPQHETTHDIALEFDIKSSDSKPIEPEKPSGELELDETINSLSGVKIEIDKGTIKPEGMTIKFINDSNLEYIFSEDFLIQKKIGDSWEDIKPILKEGEYGFNDIALMLPSGETNDWAVDWKWLYGTLEEGQYRIVKTVIADAAPGDIEAHYMGAEFEIK